MQKICCKLLNGHLAFQLPFQRKFHNSNIVLKTSELKKLLTLVNSSPDALKNTTHDKLISASTLQLESGITLISDKTSNKALNNSAYKPFKKAKPEWLIQKQALKGKFEQWNPNKKLSRDEMESVRLLKENMPHLNNTDIGHHFKISPEAVRRILKSKFTPRTERERQKIEDRWVKRGERIKQLMDDKEAHSTLGKNERHRTIFLKGSTDKDFKNFKNKKQSKILDKLKNIKL